MADKTFEERKKIIYDFINDPRYVPMKQKELAIILQVEKRDREELNKVLDELLSEGKISLSKRGRYGKAEIKKAMPRASVLYRWRTRSRISSSEKMTPETLFWVIRWKW